jgi:hypothetical protein
MSHSQAATSVIGSDSVVVTGHILEGIASLPLIPAPADITLHGVVVGKIVPRPKKMDGLNTRFRLTGWMSAVSSTPSLKSEETRYQIQTIW